MKNDITKALKTAFPYTLPILAGFWVLGFAFGILMSVNGFSYLYSFFSSVIVFAGSLQFVMMNMLLGIFNPIQTFFMALMINARHLFYGVPLLKKYKDVGLKKIYLIFALCDETFSINYATDIPEDVNRGWFYFFVTLLNQSYWVIATTCGGLFGEYIQFNTRGLDFVMTAMFTVILYEQWTKSKTHLNGWIGICSSIFCLIVFGKDDFMIPTMIFILALLLLNRKRLEESAK